MIHTAFRPCPCCGQLAVARLHTMHFALPEGSTLPNAYDVVACESCAFTYADTRATTEDYELHYTQRSHYEDPSVATGGGDSDSDRERIAALAGRLAEYAPRSARVLDIGCGNGGLLDALKARGFTELAGIDPAPGCIARLHARGYPAWQGSLSQLPAAAAMADLVVLSHVLEHVLDVRGALEGVRSRLRTGGSVYIETPDATRYAGRDFVPYYFFDSEHINHFDAESLAAVGGLGRYEVLHVGEGELMVEGGHRYPEVHALLQSVDRPASADRPRFTRLKEAVYRYAQESAARSEDAALAAIVASGRPRARWGAGSHAQRLLKQPPLAGVRFLAVLDRDRNKHGLIFAGCRIQAPETGLSEVPSDTVVVVAAALAASTIVAECRDNYLLTAYAA